MNGEIATFSDKLLIQPSGTMCTNLLGDIQMRAQADIHARVALRIMRLCTLSASQAGSPGYDLPALTTANVQVVAVSQTITFAPVGDQPLASGSVVLSASASSGLAVSFTSNTTTICTVSGTTVNLVAAGTCAITANQAGNASYAAAPAVTQTFQVTIPSSNGGGDSADVPMPHWVLVALGILMLGGALRAGRGPARRYE